jgi:pyruvate ferredoxin oxidoreductase gamma subunit
MLRVRFHGRGGQGVKTASRMLGDAAFAEGLDVQDFPLYGAERRGAPVTAFTRISDHGIMERGYIFDPDVVAVLDETLLGDPLARPLEGVREGGAVLVNTTRSIAEIDAGRSDVRVIPLDLTGRSLHIVGQPILSAAVAAAVARISAIPEASLLRGVSEELKEVGLPEGVIAKNLELARFVYRELQPVRLETREAPGDQEMATLEMIEQGDGSEDITSPGNSAQRHTGDWRIFRPVIDYAKCTTCMVCYVYCPDSAIVVRTDGKVAIDYDNCKGCMICMNECPLRAITGEREAELE